MAEKTNEVQLYNRSTETDDVYSLFLELSEDDPLFKQKEELLQIKGIDLRAPIYIKSFSFAENINAILGQMLQMARIIHLNEAELYFGCIKLCGEDLTINSGYYSPRNELEALNSIISIIDISLAKASDKVMRTLQDLRHETIDMISNFGGKCQTKARVVASECDKEKCLLNWGETNGVTTKLQVAYVEGEGRGAIATEDLKVGDIALEIPVPIMISEDVLCESDMFHILKDIDGITPETMLLLWSMKEKFNPNSRFKIYFDTLPEEFNTGLSFGVRAIIASEGTLLFDEIMQAKEHLRLQYNELFPELCTQNPDTFPPEVYTWENFLWACELWYSNSMTVKFPNGNLRTCLIPIAGFLNHSLCPHIMHYGKVDPETNSFKFPMSRPCKIGEQCYLSYGNFSSSHLATFYGFIPQGVDIFDINLYDVIPIDIDCTGDEDPVECSTYHMLRGPWLSENDGIFHYGLPAPFLDHFRKTLCPKLHPKVLTQSSLETEIEVLEIICSLFTEMMDKLGETSNEDRKCSSWDVKLAVRYKDIQSRIVSSVIISCYTGKKLVADALTRCMEEDITG